MGAAIHAVVRGFEHLGVGILKIRRQIPEQLAREVHGFLSHVPRGLGIVTSARAVVDEQAQMRHAEFSIIERIEDEVVPHLIELLGGSDRLVGNDRHVKEPLEVFEALAGLGLRPLVFIHHPIHQRIELEYHDAVQICFPASLANRGDGRRRDDGGLCCQGVHFLPFC